MKYEKRINIDGNKLRKLIRESGHTQIELSDRMGASYSLYLGTCCAENKINEWAIWWLEENCGINYVDYAVEEPQQESSHKVSVNKESYQNILALAAVMDCTSSDALNRIVAEYFRTDTRKVREAKRAIGIARKLGAV